MINRPFFLAICFLTTACTAHGQNIGNPFPEWTPGTLDIHHISTGRGDAAFYIFPDGTTLLFDAGELSTDGPPWRIPRYVSPRPDSTRSAGEWITRYINRRMAGQARLDYAMLSHFHADHMGGLSSKSTPSPNGPYKQTGITYVGDHIPIGLMLDHGWPDYDYPVPQTSADMLNYRAFLDWQIEHTDMKAAAFEPGRHDQIKLLYNASAYPTFRIQNITANGEVWTGVAHETRQHFPPLTDLKKEDYPTENISSIAYRLSYGKFDFYTGGDLYGIPPIGDPAWHDIETPVAQVVGPVEAAVLNHHGYVDSQNTYFVQTLRPRIWLIQVWDSAHPTAMVYQRLQSEVLYPGPRDIFATAMHPSNEEVVVGLDRLQSNSGHIVVRVAPGGASYQVIILDDSDESDRVIAVHGPYISR